jgi:hypothetical protein
MVECPFVDGNCRSVFSCCFELVVVLKEVTVNIVKKIERESIYPLF